MNRSDLKLHPLGERTLQRIMDHMEKARGERPSKNQAATQAFIFMLNQITAGKLSQVDLATREGFREPVES